MKLQRLAFPLLLIAALVAPTLAGQARATLLIPKDRALGALGLKHQRVTIDVKGGTAITQVEQVFTNPTNRPLEATYLFPLPKDAVLLDVQLQMGDEMVSGKVLPKGEATRIYTDIVRRMRDPALIDWMDGMLFRARIFPVPARGEQKIALKFTTVLPFMDGSYKVHYPLKTPAQSLTTLQDFTLTVNLRHDTAVKAIYSPSHKVAVRRKGDHRAVIGFEADRVTLDRDFLLYFGVSKRAVGMSLLTHRPPDKNEPGYFLLMAAPKAVLDADQLQGKAMTLVLDTSGSMSGEKMRHAKAALDYCLERLGPKDTFNVIRFSSDVEGLYPGLQPANKGAIEEARAFVAGFEAGGGTAIDDALAEALAQKPPADAYAHLVVFLTDGRPTVGQTQIKKILQRGQTGNPHEARVFTLGVGDDVNTHLLDQLAESASGASDYVKPNASITHTVAALYNKLAYPVMTDLKLKVSNARTFAMVPGELPDLFKGQQVLVVGRYRQGADALFRLSGRFEGKQRTFDFEGTLPDARADNRFVAAIWAHRQVGFLLDQVRLNGETPELKQEIVQLATRFGIVTPYTSFLVVEPGMNVGRPQPDRPIRPTPRPPRREFRVRGGADRKAKGAPAAAARPDPAPAAEAEEDALDMARQTAGGSAGPVREQSGKRSVKTAKALRRLKDKETSESQVASVRRASGRVFSWRSGTWVQQGSLRGRTIGVAPFSDAWLAIAAAHPGLRAAMSLGESVRLQVGGVVLHITPTGAKALSAKDRKALGVSR